jgi:hypothetical protein
MTFSMQEGRAFNVFVPPVPCTIQKRGAETYSPKSGDGLDKKTDRQLLQR